ncbi:MAG: PHP domain-containing protein, partial [Thermodesulfobacteriota bacterium]
MIHLGLQTEYSFRKCFGRINDIVKHIADMGHTHAGIADVNNTFGHTDWDKACKQYGVSPIFGVRLWVIKEKEKWDARRCNNPLIFIAKNDDGLQDIYSLVKKAYVSFHYIPRLYEYDLMDLDNVYIGQQPFVHDLTLPLDFFAIENSYILPQDKAVYEVIAGAQKRGNDYYHKFERTTYPRHILTDDECEYHIPKHNIITTNSKAGECSAKLPMATMAKYTGGNNLELICRTNLTNWGLDSGEYSGRLEYEINLIKEKGYMDYFMIVADMVNDAKKTMFVGPSRGSSAGSLVCYLLGITTIDPIRFNLLFERFIDINRCDLPDSDIDFPDRKREKVVKWLRNTYGSDNVSCLGTINRLKPRSAINEFAMGLGIPKYETENVKNSIIERSGGDERASMCIADTFETTEPGKEFVKQYPEMSLASRAEAHAVYSGKHAAGIIVADRALTEYGGVNAKKDIIMLDKNAAEYIGLLKIDCLGLRTLSVLEDVADSVGWEYEDIYTMPLNDEKVFKIFNDMRLNGIFQFEGQSLRILTRQIGVHKFDDIVALTALARP